MIETDATASLDVVRIPRGADAPRRSTTNLADVSREVVESFATRAGDRNVRLRLSVGHDEAVVTIACDPDRARLVITELVAHAMAHAPAGGEVRLSVNYHAGPFGDRRALVSVNYGASAGLSASQRLAVGIGGSIVAASDVRGGTVFTLVLPAS